MKCAYCGAENADSSKFCLKCGAQLTSEKNGTSSGAIKKPDSSSIKKIVIALAAITAVILLILLISSLFKGNRFSFMEASIISVYIEDDDETEIFYNGESLGTIDGMLDDCYATIDGTAKIFLTEYEELYLATKDSLVKVDEDVYDCVISSEGDYIAYTTCMEDDYDESYALYHYNVKKKAAEKICSDYATSIVMSPDGKSVGYSTKEESDDDDYYYDYIYIAYLYHNDKKIKVGKEDCYIIGISNGAKQVYYLDETKDALYVTDAKGKDTQKLSAEPDTLYFNKDCTEILFSVDDKVYVSVKGKEKIKLFSDVDYCKPILPGELSDVSALDSFSDLYVWFGIYDYGSYGTLCYIDKDWDVTKVSTGVSYAEVSDDNSVLYYRKNAAVYRLEDVDELEPDKIADDVSEFVLLSSGDAIFYIDSDDTLWYQKGSKDGKRVTDDVHSMRLTNDDALLFLKEYSSNSGVLYMSKKGDKTQIHDDVYMVQNGTTVYFLAEYDRGYSNLYTVNSKGKTECLCEGMYGYIN